MDAVNVPVVIVPSDTEVFVDLSNAETSMRPEVEEPVGRVVVPLMEEQIEIDRRLVETGRVVVRKHVTEEQLLVERPVEQTEVQIERVPINRFIEVAPASRVEGDTTIIPVVEEVVVVEKRLMLKEEVRLTRHTTTKSSRQVVTVRSEEAEVQRVLADALDGPGDAGRKSGPPHAGGDDLRGRTHA